MEDNQDIIDVEAVEVNEESTNEPPFPTHDVFGNEFVISDWVTYSEEAHATSSTKGKDKKEILLHGLIGLIGESAEMGKQPWGSNESLTELGDSLWYMNEIFLGLKAYAEDSQDKGQPYQFNFNDLNEFVLTCIMVFAERYQEIQRSRILSEMSLSDVRRIAHEDICLALDDFKKVYFYGVPFKNEWFERIVQVTGAWFIFSIEYVRTIYAKDAILDLANANILKLRARYSKGTFNQDESINRDYQKESEQSGLNGV